MNDEPSHIEQPLIGQVRSMFYLVDEPTTILTIQLDGQPITARASGQVALDLRALPRGATIGASLHNAPPGDLAIIAFTGHRTGRTEFSDEHIAWAGQGDIAFVDPQRPGNQVRSAGKVDHTTRRLEGRGHGYRVDRALDGRGIVGYAVPLGRIVFHVVHAF
jgi:hypothetical protein